MDFSDETIDVEVVGGPEDGRVFTVPADTVTISIRIGPGYFPNPLIDDSSREVLESEMPIKNRPNGTFYVNWEAPK